MSQYGEPYLVASDGQTFAFLNPLKTHTQNLHINCKTGKLPQKTKGKWHASLVSCDTVDPLITSFTKFNH